MEDRMRYFAMVFNQKRKGGRNVSRNPLQEKSGGTRKGWAEQSVYISFPPLSIASPPPSTSHIYIHINLGDASTPPCATMLRRTYHTSKLWGDRGGRPALSWYPVDACVPDAVVGLDTAFRTQRRNWLPLCIYTCYILSIYAYKVLNWGL